MIKAIKYISIAAGIAMAAACMTSCNEEYALPPIVMPEGGVGTGSWDNPMTAYQCLIGSVNEDRAEVWVTGYIVGVINMDLGTVLNERTAVFEAPYTINTNMMIAMDPDETNWENCASVQLPSGAVRSALNLVDHPDNKGKLVTIKGTTGSKYCGVYGLRSASAYNWGDEGIYEEEPEPDVPSVPVGSALYTMLQPTSSSIDWTFDNTELPAGLTYIWKWTDYNNAYYLNGSAFSSAVGAQDAVAYAYSPAVSLAGVTGASVSFDHAAKFQTTILSLGKFVVREKGTTAWTEFDIPKWPAAGVWTFSTSGLIDISQFDGKEVEVGFKYGSSPAGADTWEIRNLVISGNK